MVLKTKRYSYFYTWKLNQCHWCHWPKESPGLHSLPHSSPYPHCWSWESDSASLGLSFFILERRGSGPGFPPEGQLSNNRRNYANIIIVIIYRMQGHLSGSVGLSVQPLTSTQVMISRFMRLSPMSDPALTVGSLLEILSLPLSPSLSAPPLLTCSLSK